MIQEDLGRARLALEEKEGQNEPAGRLVRMDFGQGDRRQEDE